MTETIEEVVRSFWLGPDRMSPRRARCANSLLNLNVAHRLVTDDNVRQLEVAGHPFHRSYDFLTPVHKSDYLRCYVMNFHGGGYTDIKWHSEENNWSEAFDTLRDRPEVSIVGTRFPTANPRSVTNMLMCCQYVCRPRSEFTEAWLKGVEAFLDKRHGALEAFRKAHEGEALDQYEMPRDYPIGYFSMHTHVFFPLVDEFHATGRGNQIDYSLRSGMDDRFAYR